MDVQFLGIRLIQIHHITNDVDSLDNTTSHMNGGWGMSLIKNKSVSFNVEDLQQKELLEWASRQRTMGFSEYVKDLITRDMTTRKVITSQPMQTTQKSPTSMGTRTP